MSLVSCCTVMQQFTGTGGGWEANDVVEEEGVGGRRGRGSSWSRAAVGICSCCGVQKSMNFNLVLLSYLIRRIVGRQPCPEPLPTNCQQTTNSSGCRLFELGILSASI